MRGVSELLKNIVFEKMSLAKGSSYVLETTFTQSDNDITISPVEVESIQIRQAFVTDITDNIAIRCKFFPMDILTLLTNSQDLKITLIFRRWDRDIYSYYASEEPDIYQLNVFISNPQDILKQLPPVVFKKTKLEDYDKEILNTPMSLDMQLMDQKTLDVKRPSMNAILADTDMSSAVLYVINALGIEKTSISEIDNTKIHREIIIPGLMDMSQVFTQLQESYGIYKKGLARYFCNETMYIYPPFDIDPNRSEIVNIFKLPTGSVDGGDMYHAMEGEDLYITCFSDVQVANTSEQSTENIGNAVSVKQADASVGASIDVDKSGKITRNEQANLTVRYDSQATATKGQVNVVHGGTTNNIFSKLSDISAGQLEHVTLQWIHAKPYIIKPGMKCVYHYDDTSTQDRSDVYTTSPGIVEQAIYTLIQHAKYPSLIYRWDATITVGVVPKKNEQNNNTV